MYEYEGTKFFYVGSKTTINNFGEKEKKKIFRPSPEYLDYLEEKRKEQFLTDFNILKNKLKYQEKIYGEVDKVDLSEFIYKLQQLKDWDLI